MSDTDRPVSDLTIAAPTWEDCQVFLDAVAASRDLHHPWVQPPATPTAFASYLEDTAGRRRSYVIRQGTTLVGVVNASEIVRGAFQSCYLGYYALRPNAGRGLMTAGLRLVLADLFVTVGLHRVEANIQPGNRASLALVRRLGFAREGFSPNYLFIDGAWRDHERWALRATGNQVGWPPPSAAGAEGSWPRPGG